MFINFLLKQNIYFQGFIISSIIFLFIFFILLLIILFQKKFKNFNINLKYLYSFSSGFLIVTAIAGQWVSARERLANFFINNKNGISFTFQTIISISIFIFAILFGALISFVIKKKSLTKDKHYHSHEAKNSSHSHFWDLKSEILEENKTKKKYMTIIYMMLSHTIPFGLLLGFLLVNLDDRTKYSFATLLTTMLHIVPEIILIYFSKQKSNSSKKNSFLFTLAWKLLIFPFIFLGIFLANLVNNDAYQNWFFWIIPFILISVGVIMIWASIFELGPVFIHSTQAKNNIMFLLIFMFILGASCSMIIQLIHFH